VSCDGLAARLWTANGAEAAAALRHPFVRGLAAGNLPHVSFAGFVAQDAYFLESFARAYALALARSPDREGLEAFHGLIGGVLDELRVHAGYAARHGIDMGHAKPEPATLAYTDFLLATASLGVVGEACAALTPCMRLYAFLGQALADEGAGHASNPYREWVETYAAPGFDKLASTLERLLDRYAQDTPRVHAIYRRAMWLELAFFDAHIARN
jgi:thiaminase/transcriptional activator TenA